MTLTYTECKALKDNGFPQEGALNYYAGDGWYNEQPSILTGESLTSMNKVYCPSLDKLIEECEKSLQGTDSCITISVYPHTNGKGWGEEPVEERRKVYAITNGWRDRGEGNNASSAVCALWLALNKK